MHFILFLLLFLQASIILPAQKDLHPLVISQRCSTSLPELSPLQGRPKWWWVSC